MTLRALHLDLVWLIDLPITRTLFTSSRRGGTPAD
jgi:hypothetical protein